LAGGAAPRPPVIEAEIRLWEEDHFHVGHAGAVWFTQPPPSIDAPFG
jgi:hypothetical protein